MRESSGLANVLFITADQWRGDTLSAVGHPCIRTPALDALAEQGTLFRRHHTVAYPCGPSRASLLTGLYPHTHRSVRNGTPLDARHGNLAQEVRRGGLEPLLFGYTDTSLDPRGRAPDDPARHSYEGVAPGFTPVLNLSESSRAWIADLIAKGYDVPAPEQGRDPLYDPDPAAEAAPGGFGPTRIRAEDSETAFMTDQVLRHLAVLQGKPWFVHLTYICPHPPFAAPAPWHLAYDPAATPAPLRGPSAAAEGAQHPLLAGLHRAVPLDKFLNHAKGPASALDAAGVAAVRAAYYGLASEVDHHLGRVFEFLKASGQWDDTLIVFTSDHGEQLGDHHLFGKLGYFDQSAHIPLILRDPRPAADAGRGRQVDDFTESVDILPTILGWLGLPVPRHCDGRSLLPFCAGERPQDWRDAAHWFYDFGNVRERLGEARLHADECGVQVIRDARRKYVHCTALPPLFFDLERDPGEFEDRSCDPAYAAEMLTYAQKLLSWRMRHEDRTLSHITLEGGYFEEEAR
jgi:arylsulfatase A-like enzyme